MFSSYVQNNFELILSERKLELIEIISQLTKRCPTHKIFTIVDFFQNLNEYLSKFNYTTEDIMNTFKNIYMIYLNNIMLLTIYDNKFFIKLNNSKIEPLSENEYYYFGE